MATAACSHVTKATWTKVSLFATFVLPVCEGRWFSIRISWISWEDDVKESKILCWNWPFDSKWFHQLGYRWSTKDKVKIVARGTYVEYAELSTTTKMHSVDWDNETQKNYVTLPLPSTCSDKGWSVHSFTPFSPGGFSMCSWSPGLRDGLDLVGPADPRATHPLQWVFA